MVQSPIFPYRSVSFYRTYLVYAHLGFDHFMCEYNVLWSHSRPITLSCSPPTSTDLSSPQLAALPFSFFVLFW